MITEYHKKRISSSNNKPKKTNNKKEKNNLKRSISLTPSLTNMNMISYKTKRIYNKNRTIQNNSNSISNTKQKNKILENKKYILKNDKKFKSLIGKEVNNSLLNYNSEMINRNINYNTIINNNTNNINENNLSIKKNDNNYIIRNEMTMNLYKVNSLSNIQKAKQINHYFKIRPNKHNSTLTGTTTCSYMKQSSIYNEKNSTKPIKKRNNFYQNDIMKNDNNSKKDKKVKCYNIISKQFSFNNNPNSNNNKTNIKTEIINPKYFQKNILSQCPSIEYINSKRDILYEKLNRKKSGIFPIRKVFFNLKDLKSSLTSRNIKETSKARVVKSTINNDKIYSIYEHKKKMNLKNLKNKSFNLKSVKNIKSQTNNFNNNKIYLNTFYGYFSTKK